MFRTVPLSITRSFSLYTQQCYMSYRSADSLQAGSWCSILILLTSCQQTCMTYTTVVCTVKNSWWWTEEPPETCRLSFQNKIEKLVHLVGFIIRNLSRCTVTWTSKLIYLLNATALTPSGSSIVEKSFLKFTTAPLTATCTYSKVLVATFWAHNTT